VPFVELQTVLHAPQFDTLLVVLISQPFDALLSQFAKPALHVMPQTPAEHVAVPLVELQIVVQRLQCVGSVLRLISHPFDTRPSQLPYPALQVIPQVPVVQLGAPFAALHAVEQLPQCVTSVFRLDSQPLPTLPSQLPYPVEQVMPHAPLVQVAVPLTVLHTLPQVPQFDRFELVLTSQPFATLPSQFA
jgi:hypothetical protein